MAVIDMGGNPLDQAYTTGGDAYTYIDKTNPANDTGTIDTFQFWYQTNATSVSVGTAYGSGTDWTVRAYANVGNIAAGSVQTVTGLSIAVSANDIVAWYNTPGAIDNERTGGSGIGYVAGNKMGGGANTYTLIASYVVSIYGTGTTAAGGNNYTASTSFAIGVKPITSKLKAANRSVIRGIGVKSTSYRLVALNRNVVWGVGVKVIASKIPAYAKYAIWGIGVKIIASKQIAINRLAIWGIGVKAVPSKLSTFIRSSTFGIGVKSVAKKGIALSIVFGVGVKAVTSRLVSISRPIIYGIGIKAIYSKGLALSAIFGIGVKSIPSKLTNYMRSIVWGIGIKGIGAFVYTFAGGAVNYIQSAAYAIGVKAISSKQVNFVRAVIFGIGVKAIGIAGFPHAVWIKGVILIGRIKTIDLKSVKSDSMAIQAKDNEITIKPQPDMPALSDKLTTITTKGESWKP